MQHLLISAAHKSSGKTTVTLGLASALAHRGMDVQAFKKGPDYIDPMWLTRASGRPCYNLDFQTQGHDEIHALFSSRSAGAGLALIEGNMGMFDSVDTEGESSNAALARLLDAPVVLVVNTQGMNRSVAPLVLGFQHFDPRVRFAGVILNKVAGSRHERKLREAIERYTDLPLLGVIHRDPGLAITERHLGLVPSNEAGEVDAKLAYIREVIEQQVDLDRLLGTAGEYSRVPEAARKPAATDVRIGIARDAAFGFYYPDDLEALQAAGAELVEFDPMRDSQLPAVDGLFIGGGFPETHLDALEANGTLREAIREAIEAGMPTYAECGGLMYLTRSIHWRGQRAQMVGVIAADTVMHDRPMGRGSVTLAATAEHPWFGDGALPARINAHEFHYSTLENASPDTAFAYTMLRGSGIDGARDGIVYRNLLASYTHLRDVAAFHWAEAFVGFVRRHRDTPTLHQER